MLRRLLEASYVRDSSAATAEQVAFWLDELRTPEFLVVDRRTSALRSSFETSAWVMPMRAPTCA